MVALVQVKSTVGASGSSAAVSISSTAGNTLVIVADCYKAVNAPYHITGIGDGHNTWTFSPANSNQNPPVGQSWSGAYEGLILIGAVVAAAAVTSVTVNFSASLDYCDLIVYEFSGVPAGASVAAAASSSTLVTAASVTTPPVTVPSGASLAVAAQTNLGNAGSNTSASTGWTINTANDTDHCSAYRVSPAAGSLTATFTSTSSQQWPSSAILVIGQTAVTHSGTASLSGSGSLGPSGTDIKPAGTGLSGHGDLAAAGVPIVPASAGLTGTGALSGTGEVLTAGYHAALSGSGSLGPGGVIVKMGAAGLTGHGDLLATRTVAGLDGEGSLTAAGVFAATAGLTGTGVLGAPWTHAYLAGLDGQGSFTAYEKVKFAGLDGQGSFVILGERLGYVAGLTGVGSFSIPQVAGGLVNGVGGVGRPLALPGSSQVAVAPPGSANWQWVGTLGHVTALKYSYTCPGGCDKMSMTVMVPAAYRTQLFNPGWQVKITRGGHDVWHGKLDEPQPTPQGWNLTAVGHGNRGTDFMAYYAVMPWPDSEPDEILNRAIIRGLPWVNPGFNSSPYFSQFWFGQAVDPAAQTVAAFLNLLCTRGGLTWYVNSQPGGVYNGDDLQIFPLPATVSRLLVVDTPVARTLGGDINYIIIRYQATADNTTTNQAATYGFVAATNPQSIAAHGELETYIDLSDAGVMTAAQAQAVGNNVLAIYQRASFAGPFQGSYGQLLNTGGQPIDPGTDQAGTVVRLILTDFGYGGEVVPQFPISFIVGAYEWDDFAQVFTVTPYQNVDQSLTGLLSLQNTIMTPIQVAS